MKNLIFGEIEGTKIGDVFKDRKSLSKSKIHTPTMSGIWGRQNEGACSIVLSEGYEDDIDELDYIFYTGHGGQNVPGGKQTSDQVPLRGNKAMMLSVEYDLPIRVTRGHQTKNGPPKGYRYDGIYYVNRYEKIKGKSGFYVFRFHLYSELKISDLEKKIINNLKSDYSRAPRSKINIDRIIRNIKLSEKIKKFYDYKCQICNVSLKTPFGKIAIAAHIKRLGKPDHGPDTLGNMICLCPNHHDLFDNYGYYIDDETNKIKGLKEFVGKKIKFNKNHKVIKEFLKFHKKKFIQNN